MQFRHEVEVSPTPVHIPLVLPASGLHAPYKQTTNAPMSPLAAVVPSAAQAAAQVALAPQPCSQLKICAHVSVCMSCGIVISTDIAMSATDIVVVSSPQPKPAPIRTVSEAKASTVLMVPSYECGILSTF